jgi:hypothetical protein
MLDEINLVDTSRKFTPWWCSMQRHWLRWTWHQKHRGCWIYSQPDYIMVQEGDIRRFRKVSFQSPPSQDESLHGCQNGRGTGTAIIEAKLAQQLAHLEQKPFFGIFLDLKNLFNAMDRDQWLLVLEGYGAGPNMQWLTHHFWVRRRWFAAHQ